MIDQFYVGFGSELKGSENEYSSNCTIGFGFTPQL